MDHLREGGDREVNMTSRYCRRVGLAVTPRETKYL